MELYYYEMSSPCRAVLLFVKELNLNPVMKKIDLLKGENLSPDYLKLNPQHTIPLIIDDGYVLSESRAILVYLAERYDRDSIYYPNDAKTRGVISQRLMFDIGTLSSRFYDTYSEFFIPNGSNRIDLKKINKLGEAFEFLEAFMGDSLFMAGNVMTIADYSIVATVSTIEACGFDFSKYERVSAWFERCKTEMLDYEEINQKGADLIGNMVQPYLEKSQAMNYE
ncbi:GSTD1-5 protein, putative [Pediculus humanus corporis]|uniref:GSTD1-5 protein, putative n=1 Tax=Pediculus humanus subsp. corporis TaxID=121224 RepID=E0VGM3_PEDHC|nr:GSTD1-5 protein, putative [Pediculus humanus corporis]EEB12529.1 GSTD1-5 protein, putative [Pediculus humanus corporis]